MLPHFVSVDRSNVEQHLAMKHYIVTLFLVALVGCQSSLPLGNKDQAAEDTSVVAVFADQQLDINEFEQRYLRAVGTIDQARSDSLTAYADFLERYINFRLKLLDAKERGFDHQAVADSEITLRPGELARHFLVNQKRDQLLRQLYKRSRTDVEVSHVMIRFDQNPSPADTLKAYKKAQSVLDSLKTGLSFAKAAARYSDTPSAARDSGYVGYLPAGRAYQVYEDYAYNTPEGEYSPVFKTHMGYFILKVHGHRPSRPDRKIAHIMVSLGSSKPQDTLRAYQQIQQLQDSLRAGSDFARIARRYSQHSQTAARGGGFGFASYDDLNAAPRFADAAFAIDTVGAVSDIVRSRFGYHLIKLLDERDYSTFEAARPHLTKTLSKLPRGKNLERKVARQLFQEYGKSVDSTVVASALTKLPSDSAWTVLKTSGFDPADRSKVFASLGDSTYTLADLEASFQGQAKKTLKHTVYTQVNDFLRQQAFAYAIPALKKRDPQFARTLNEYYNGLLLFQATEATVWNPAQNDSSAIRAYYDKHQQRYRFPERRRVVSFEARTEETLTQVSNLLDKHNNLQTVQQKIEKESIPVRVDTVFISSKTESVYDRVFDLAPGKHSEILEHNNNRLLLLLDSIEAPRPKTYTEARAEVVRHYQSQLERQWMKKLHDRYNVELYPERLRHVFLNDQISSKPLDKKLPSGTYAQ